MRKTGRFFKTPALAATAAEVYSSNVVGYSKVAIQSGFNLIGSQYVSIGSNTDFDVNELMTSQDLPGLDASFAFQTVLKVWNGGGYYTYGYCADGQGTENGEPSWDGKWLLNDMSGLASDTIRVGEGFWIKSDSPATITISGQVATNASYSANVSAGFNLLSNPYPAPLDINTMTSDNLPGLDADFAFQTILKVWNGGGYYTYGYCADGQGTENGAPAWDGKWLLNDMSDLADVTIPSGNGFWVKTSAPATITFPSPLR